MRRIPTGPPVDPKRQEEERRETAMIALLPYTQRRAAVRKTAAYKRLRRRTRAQRRAFGGWAGAFRPPTSSQGPKT